MKKFLLFILAVLAVLPVYAQEQKSVYSLSYENSTYIYKEPYIDYRDSQRGRMQGVVLDYLTRSAFTDDKDIDPGDPSFVAVQLRYMTGEANYDGFVETTSGGVTTDTPSYSPDIKNYYIEGRLTSGGVYNLGSYVELWPYLGIGGRYLVNKMDKSEEGGYRRTSTYIYAPVGLSTRFKLPAKFYLSFNGEYDFFIHGKQYSRLSDIGANIDDASKQQDKGYGARFSVKLEKNYKHFGVFAEPFYRFWHIKDSKLSDWVRYGNYYTKFIEPENITQEAGIKAGINF